MKNEWSWHNFMSYGCFIKMYYFQFYTFCVLDPLVFFFSSHMFSQAFEKAGLQEALCQRGLLARRPWLLLLKALPKTLTRPSPHFWHLLILCSCISAQLRFQLVSKLVTELSSFIVSYKISNHTEHFMKWEMWSILRAVERGHSSPSQLPAIWLVLPFPPRVHPLSPHILQAACASSVATLPRAALQGA